MAPLTLLPTAGTKGTGAATDGVALLLSIGSVSPRSMHIKKLDIAGFKSFVDRTSIHFDHDVTGIVGPNGCGKSNIVDAIRWCMGEQSSRQLRGKTMGDVLFAGSESRKPHGLAEVTITFSNADSAYARTLPLEYRDYPEIAVTRRLYRDGTSEYLVNKTSVRLKDINELFLGTGVGSKAYSIIEQGKIGMIVSAKPEDRRLFIEEAAGITKYKHRKKQAELKMDLTKQNLLRVGDIVAEIDRSIVTLKRQATKAKRYLEYRKEHDDALLHEASHRLLDIIATEKLARSNTEASRHAVEHQRTELSTHQCTLEAARADCVLLERQVDKDQNDAFIADNEVRTCDAKAQRSLDRFNTLKDRLLAATQESQRLRHDSERLCQELDTVSLASSNLETTEGREAELLRIEEERLRACEQDQHALESNTTRIRNAFAKASADAAAAKERLAAFDRQISDIRFRKERLKIDAERFGEDLNEAKERRESVVETIEGLRSDIALTNEQVAVLSIRLNDLRQSVIASGRELDGAKNDVGQSRSTLKALEEIHARLEGVGAGTKAIVDTKAACIMGMLADAVEPPEGLLKPFAAMLGYKLQSVLVDNEDSAISLLESLERNKLGRATVLPVESTDVETADSGSSAGSVGSGINHHELDVSRDSSKSDESDIARSEPFASVLGQRGVIGLMASLLRFEPYLRRVVRALVGGALLVDNADVARRLRDDGFPDMLVTLSGMVFHRDGRISGGAGDDAAASLMQQKIRMREMRVCLAEHDRIAKEALDKHETIRLSLELSTQQLEQARTCEREIQLEKVTLDNDLRRAEDQITSISARIGDTAKEIDALDGQLDDVSVSRDDAERMLSRSEADALTSSGELELAERESRDLAELVSVQKEACTERKVEFARFREQANSARATMARLQRALQESNDRNAELEHEFVSLAMEQGRLAAEVMSLRDRMKDAQVAANAAHVDFEKRRRALDDARNAIGSREAKTRSMRDQLDKSLEQQRELEMTLQRLELERQHILDTVSEKFRGLRLTMVVGDYHMRPPPDASHRARIDELAGLIDRMGPVNLDAMDEYEKAAERFEYYTSQKADLEKALSDLEHAIQQMNKESRRLFRSTFDSINARFQEVFPRMFKGGRASLLLTNPDDLLETGVDIQAQPPGKKVGTIELLSGGEKALTAVSLIFAIFQHRPSPFCVLDEVDAPLDDANVARFNELVRSMTDSSQFILITHIKRTMQSVDVLYGVTMQEPGVSRLVSVKVNAATQARWPDTCLLGTEAVA